MPELPEVETVARALRDRISGRVIEAVEVLDDKLGARNRLDRAVGATIVKVVRRGKFLGLGLNGKRVLLLHLMMSGRLLVRRSGEPADKYPRLILRLSGLLELRFCDPRRFGTAALLAEKEYLQFSQRMGFEPLSSGFTAAKLGEILAGRSAAVKSVLMNQKRVAGIGNIYADEALWHAGINPALPAGRLNGPQAARLHRAVRMVLKQGLLARGTTFQLYADADGQPGQNQGNLKVFRRTGQPCPRCGTLIARSVVGGRSTHFCPRCQPLTRFAGWSAGATRKVRSPR